MTTVFRQDSLGVPVESMDPSGGGAIPRKVHAYIVENLLFDASEIDDETSLVEAGILDSTAAMELVAFLESEFALKITDEDLVPENLDSIRKIKSFVERKLDTATASR